MDFRIHITGASGSGTTTLAKYLAKELNSAHFDVDQYFWEKTNPPFTTQRPVAHRLELLKTDLSQQPSWTLSGSMVGWGDPIASQFTHIVFLYIPPEIRLKRLKERERLLHGSRIDSGGDMAQIHTHLMEWAAKYDKGGMEVRSKLMHEAWLASMKCPVIRIESPVSTEEQAKITFQKIHS